MNAVLSVECKKPINKDEDKKKEEDECNDFNENDDTIEEYIDDNILDDEDENDESFEEKDF